jgi:hypothetical protein
MKTKQAEFTLSAKDRAELEKIVGDTAVRLTAMLVAETADLT